MNSFLQNLVARSLSEGPTHVQPRLPGPFDQPSGVGPRVVEPMSIEQEKEDEAWPREMTLKPERNQETAPAHAMATLTSSEPEEQPGLSPTNSREEPDLPKPITVTPSEQKRQEEPLRVVQHLEPEPETKPPVQVDLRLKKEAPQATTKARARGPVRQPVPPTSPRPSTPFKQEEQRFELLDAPGKLEQPQAVTIERVARPQIVDHLADLPAVEITPALSTPFQPPTPDPGRASAAPPEVRPIQVTIGRIDVRAVFSPPPMQPAAPRPGPTMSLDDYLKQRDGGRT